MARVTPGHESCAAENLRLVDSPRNGSFLRSAYGPVALGCGTNLMPRHALVVHCLAASSPELGATDYGQQARGRPRRHAVTLLVEASESTNLRRHDAGSP